VVDDPLDCSLPPLDFQLRDTQFRKKLAFAGEIGLVGKIRAVSQSKNRICWGGEVGFQEDHLVSNNAIKGLDLKKTRFRVSAVSKTGGDVSSRILRNEMRCLPETCVFTAGKSTIGVWTATGKADADQKAEFF